VFKHLSALEMGKAVVAELVQRSALDPTLIERIVFGSVVPDVQAPNIAREVVLASGLPRTIDSFSVSRACATSTQALVDVAQAILVGDIEVAVAGGAESLSRVPITVSDALADALMSANAAKDPLGKAKPFLELGPKDLLPRAPSIKETATGMSMGDSAEKMAKENGIARADQDAFALRSQRKAAAAWDKGIYDHEVMHMLLAPGYERVVVRDGIVRSDTSLEKLASLPPVFDRAYGSVTAGSSSPLTDGAAALVVMSEKRAEMLGFKPLAFVRSWAFTALDPSWQLLMGPVFAAPIALARAGLTLQAVDLVDMHEAFAAQVLSNLYGFASKPFNDRYRGGAAPLGEVPDDKLNIYGGSVSLGHPFGATGARQALTMSRELDRRGKGTALITQCAAGGLGAALVLERS
jgi:acetyl-CoA acyltransferase